MRSNKLNQPANGKGFESLIKPPADLLELLVLVVAAVALFVLGWQFGKLSATPATQAHAATTRQGRLSGTLHQIQRN